MFFIISIITTGSELNNLFNFKLSSTPSSGSFLILPNFNKFSESLLKKLEMLALRRAFQNLHQEFRSDLFS